MAYFPRTLSSSCSDLFFELIQAIYIDSDEFKNCLEIEIVNGSEVPFCLWDANGKRREDLADYSLCSHIIQIGTKRMRSWEHEEYQDLMREIKNSPIVE